MPQCRIDIYVRSCGRGVDARLPRHGVFAPRASNSSRRPSPPGGMPSLRSGYLLLALYSGALWCWALAVVSRFDVSADLDLVLALSS